MQTWNGNDNVYRVWANIRGVQPFFPIYARSLPVGIYQALDCSRHVRILKEFAEENPQVYVSAFRLTGDIQRPIQITDAVMAKRFRRVIFSPRGKLADFDQVTKGLPPNRFSHIGESLFVNPDSPPSMVEIARYEVILPELIKLFAETKDTRTRIHALIDDISRFINPLKFRLNDPNLELPKSSSPNRDILRLDETPTAELDISLNYLESLPPELVYQIASSMKSGDLATICSTSQRLRDLFCSDDASWFWALKFKDDFPHVLLPIDGSADMRRLYFKQINRSRIESVFSATRISRHNYVVFDIILFLTGLINKTNVHPYPFSLLMEDMKKIGYDSINSYFEFAKDPSGREYPKLNELGRLCFNRPEFSASILELLRNVLKTLFPDSDSYRFVYSPLFFRDTVYTTRQNIYEKTFLRAFDNAYLVDQTKIDYSLEAVRFIIEHTTNDLPGPFNDGVMNRGEERDVDYFVYN
jgi:hypothetical protein